MKLQLGARASGWVQKISTASPKSMYNVDKSTAMAHSGDVLYFGLKLIRVSHVLSILLSSLEVYRIANAFYKDVMAVSYCFPFPGSLREQQVLRRKTCLRIFVSRLGTRRRELKSVLVYSSRSDAHLPRLPLGRHGPDKRSGLISKCLSGYVDIMLGVETKWSSNESTRAHYTL